MEKGTDQLNAADRVSEFPLKAQKDLTQVISFPSDDGQCAEDIVCSKVCILPYVTTGEKKSSSMLEFKNEVDYNWENKFYHGQLVAVHRKGHIYAYAIAGQSRDGSVRIVSEKGSLPRLLVKGMKGPIQDLAFASYDAEIILAVVDEPGNLYVYKVTHIDNDLRVHTILEVQHDILARKDTSHRVVWVPYVPDGEADDDDTFHNWNVLALLLGSRCELWEIDEVSKYGTKPLKPEQVKNGLLVVDGHADVITDATFSPDGTALATISLDGSMQFYQVYFHEQPRSLHNWQPHGGKPLTCVFFLDDHTSDSNESQFWKFVVTGTDGNRELKVWDCKAWSHLQTITLSSEPVTLKAAIDSTAKFLLLSDQLNQMLYLFRVFLEKNDSGAHLKSVSTYLVPFSILSFTIVEATRMVKRNSIDLDEFADETDDEDDENELEEKTLLSLYVVNPKSLKKCQLQVLAPPRGSLLTFSSLVPDQIEPPHPISLLTPKEFASPAKPPEVDPGALVVKEEVVDVLASGGSSPSREVRDILASHDKDVKEEPETSPAEAPAPQEWPLTRQEIGDGPLAVKKRESLGVSETRLETIAATGATEATVAGDLSHKLDTLLTLVQSQETVVQDLKKKIRNLDQQNSLAQDKMKRTLDGHAEIIVKQFARSEAQERDRRETLLCQVSQTIENLIAVKLEEIVPTEIRKNVLPEILSDLEPLKHQLHVEMTQKLSATDHLLKENISKLVQSKSVMDVMGLSIASAMRSSMPEIFKDLLGSFVIPRLEKVLEKTFHQVHETFTTGTRECLSRLGDDVQKVNNELKKSESNLRAISEINKEVVTNFHSDLQKTLLNVGEKLRIQMTETIHKEMMASRAATPVPTQDKHTLVSQLVSAGRVNAAFQEALSASDLDLVVFVCRKMNPETVFAKTPCPLDQPVLLSLVQQLSADMGNHTDLKCSYLTEAVLCLEQNHPTTKEHLPIVIGEVQRHINSFLVANPGSKHSRELHRILMVIKILIRGN